MQIVVNTPWRKVFLRFGLSQSQFAQAIGRHRSKITRALNNENGLISGPDQVRILAAARKANVAIPPNDFLPDGGGQ